MSAPDGGRVGAIVLAKGRSARYGGNDKVLEPLTDDGRSVLACTLQAMATWLTLDKLLLAHWALPEGAIADLLREMPVFGLLRGGPTRQESVYAGLEILGDMDIKWIVIQDGARPFVTAGLLDRVLKAAQETGAATAAWPLADAPRAIEQREGGHRLALQQPWPQGLWGVQTPQAYHRDFLLDVHRKWRDVPVTDDSEMVRRAGGDVRIVPSSADNLKLTYPAELAFFQQIARWRDL